MPSQTTNYGLWLYNSTTDQSQTFLDYRMKQSGDGLDSNMNKIDTALYNQQQSITSLTATKGLIQVSLIKSTDTHYTATGVAGLTTYINSQLLVTVNSDYVGSISGDMTVNINSLGAIAVTRRDGSYMQKGDLRVGVAYILTYSGSKYYLSSVSKSEDLSYYGNSKSIHIGVSGSPSSTSIDLGNVSIGANSLPSSNLYGNNVAVGYKAMENGSIGGNIAIGYNALNDLSALTTNATVIGTEAHPVDTISSGLVAIGYKAAGSISSAGGSVAIGSEAMYGGTSGFAVNTVAIGYQAAYNPGDLAVFQNAVMIGYQAGHSTTNGTGSIYIGYQAGYNATEENELYIANSNTATPLIYGKFSGATAGLTIYSQNDAGVPLKVKGTASQTGNLFEWQTNSTTPLLVQADGDLEFDDGTDIVFDTTTGTKIGTATSQKFAFWNAAPIVQPTTGVSASTFTANSGTAVNDASTFDGYTLGQVVKALRDMGLLA